MSVLASNANKELLRIYRERAELLSQVAGIRNSFFQGNQPQFDQDDIACALILATMETNCLNPTPIEHQTIIDSLKLPVLDKGNEIFACEFINDSVYGRSVGWAILFESEGLPKLEMSRAGDIAIVFPACDYKLMLRSSEGDFHLVHGTPRIELYTDPGSCNIPRNRRKVISKEGPFPAPPLLKEIFTGNPLKYGGLACNKDRDYHFIAAPKIHDSEGFWTASRLRECFAATLA